MIVEETAQKIRTMEIRGAGRIARAAAQALLEYSRNLHDRDLAGYCREIQRAADLLVSTRPTAVSLPNAINLVIKPLMNESVVEVAWKNLEERASGFIKRSEDAVSIIGALGARNIRDGDIILTHCNSEAALACILNAHQQGMNIEVYATEVRPRNQGHITIKTLSDAGIKTNFIVDSAARHFMKEVDLCITGADAITVNGSVINKIGTSQIALAAHESRVSFIVAAETYKFAPRTILGERILIEERTPDEILPPEMRSELRNVTVRNPTFDVTPADYVDLIITEAGVYPPEMAYTVIKEQLNWDNADLSTDYPYCEEE
ncbi:MAG: ribose 1,5-bisphosphate isomerase [Methanomicrobiales archaeon]|nr:ribose 1,5-bisphosphate isomerase [Methanomicrobiales archaeon]